MKQEPKACPFCGESFPPIALRTGMRNWWVECDQDRGGCGAEGPAVFYTRHGAVTAWNRRVVGAEPAAR